MAMLSLVTCVGPAGNECWEVKPLYHSGQHPVKVEKGINNICVAWGRFQELTSHII